MSILFIEIIQIYIYNYVAIETFPNFLKQKNLEESSGSKKNSVDTERLRLPINIRNPRSHNE